jgi:hypothetical protein
VDRAEFLDELAAEIVAGLGPMQAGDSAVRSRKPAWPRVRKFLRPTGDQLEQHVMDAADCLGAGPAEFVAAVDQQPQRHGGILDGHGA